MHNTPGAFPNLPRNLVGRLTNLDAMAQDHRKAVQTIARGIKRLTDDELIAHLCDEIDMRADDLAGLVDELAGQCGASYRDE